MKMDISSNMKFFKLYLRGRETRTWGSIRAFRYVRWQWIAEIFLAPDHMEVFTMPQ
jgi:hypothetical protein